MYLCVFFHNPPKLSEIEFEYEIPIEMSEYFVFFFGSVFIFLLAVLKACILTHTHEHT